MVTNSNLREMCDNILQLLTKESMETVLWPYLIDFLLAPEYSNAIPAVIKSLSQLAFKMRQDKKASVTSVVELEEASELIYSQYIMRILTRCFIWRFSFTVKLGF